MHLDGGALHSKQHDQIIQSDQELEATGNSWLKFSSNPLRNLQITLPSIGEKFDSKDSLDAASTSESDIYPKELRCV